MSDDHNPHAGSTASNVSDATAQMTGDVGLYATSAVRLGLASMQTIGEEAARAVGLAFDAVSVVAEPDSLDEPAYFFTYSTRRGSGWTGETRLRLGRQLRDRWLAKGDDIYPYIRLISH